MYQLLNPSRNGLFTPPPPQKTCMLLGQIWSYLSTLVIFGVPRDDIYVKLLTSSSPCSLCCTFCNRISSQREEASWSWPVWFLYGLRPMYIIYFHKLAVSLPQNLTCLSWWVMLCQVICDLCFTRLSRGMSAYCCCTWETQRTMVLKVHVDNCVIVKFPCIVKSWTTTW